MEKLLFEINEGYWGGRPRARWKSQAAELRLQAEFRRHETECAPGRRGLHTCCKKAAADTSIKLNDETPRCPYCQRPWHWEGFRPRK
jgi:hypothetical protein